MSFGRLVILKVSHSNVCKDGYLIDYLFGSTVNVAQVESVGTAMSHLSY